jgi:hypothetical protein
MSEFDTTQAELKAQRVILEKQRRDIQAQIDVLEKK